MLVCVLLLLCDLSTVINSRHTESSEVLESCEVRIMSKSRYIMRPFLATGSRSPPIPYAFSSLANKSFATMTIPGLSRKSKATKVERAAALNIAEKIAQAAENARKEGEQKITDAPKQEFRLENLSYAECFKLLAIPSAVLWLAMFGMGWYMNRDPPPHVGSFLRSILGSRIASHLGPHPIPGILKVTDDLDSELWKLTDPLAFPHERTEALLAVEAVTQRRMALQDVIQRRGMNWFLPALMDLVSEGDEDFPKAQSHFETQLRIALDVITATPQADREVPLDFMKLLVTTNEECWKTEARADEARAIILYKLFHCPANCRKARGCEEIENYIETHGELIKTTDDEDAWFKKLGTIYGHESHDILRKCVGLLNKYSDNPEKLPIPEQQERLSPSFQWKLDIRTFECSVFYYLMWPILRIMYRFQVGQQLENTKLAGRVLGMAVFGGALMEILYRSEEHLIQTKQYYNNSTIASLAMVMTHCSFLAYLLPRAPYTIVPLLVLRLGRDTSTDSYRFIN